MAEGKKVTEMLAPLLKRYNGDEPLFGNKVRRALGILRPRSPVRKECPRCSATLDFNGSYSCPRCGTVVFKKHDEPRRH